MSGATELRPARDSEWPATDVAPPLTAGAVHVWRAETASLVGALPVLARVLDASERARASAFYASHDADRYVLAHGILRCLLAQYLDTEPAAIQYEVGTYGKPRLAASTRATELRFNMSHTHDVVVFAFARGREIGVDVEQWRADVECLDLARHFFSPTENAALAALAPMVQLAGFFDCWSRKEAYIKATGLGVSRGLDYFDVALAPDQEAALLEDRVAPDARQRWRMRDLGFAPGHSGAVVAEGGDWELRRLAASAAIVGI